MEEAGPGAVEIVRLDREGEGVAADGARLAFTLPGERAAPRPGGAPAILRAAESRVAPPCRHFGACGGCALQHAGDAFVAAWKRDEIARALAAQGVDCGDLRPTATSSPRSRRRAGFAARRTKKSVLVGFHRRASDELIALEECAVVHPDILAARGPIAALARLGASRKGVLRALATRSEGGLDLALDDAKPLDAAGLSAAAGIAEAADLARLAWNGEVIALRRPPAQRFGAAHVAPPPGAFLQATAEGEAALVAATREAVGEAGRVLDLFAGCGLFALSLAGRATVHAVEADAAMLAALEAGWRGAAGLKTVTTEARDLFRRPLAGPELAGYDAAVIDPPRAGARAEAEALAAGGPPVVAAISCNPATFARDARILCEGGYRLDWALPVDQFRWSPHIELAARFSR